LPTTEQPRPRIYEQGFSDGANHVKPGVNIDIRYIADSNGNPADNAKTIAGEMFITNDVVFHHLGRHGIQVTRAASASGYRKVRFGLSGQIPTCEKQRQ
jgi:basic membrane lipoprotein Med (substrate-binding protein (PBP1-ABC) superfamily)